MFTIDSENNIAAHATTPANVDNLRLFASEKDLAKLAADGPAARLIEIWNGFAGVVPFDNLKSEAREEVHEPRDGRLSLWGGGPAPRAALLDSSALFVRRGFVEQEWRGSHVRCPHAGRTPGFGRPSIT